MIIPSSVAKIVGFKKTSTGERFPIPTEGANIAQLQLDNGLVIDINIFSNDKEFSNSLNQFLISKSNSVIKENEIKQGAFDLMTDDQERYKDLIESKKTLLTQSKPELTGKKLEQEACLAAAAEIVFNKRMIKQKSIIKLPVAIGSNQEGQSYYTSRSIQVAVNDKGVKEFGRGGIYYFAQTENAVPIEITPIKNKDGQFVGFFKVTTAKLINADQINFLLNHAMRTVTVLLSKGKKPFLLQFLKNDVAQQIPGELYSLFKALNDIEKMNRESENPLDSTIYENYNSYLLQARDLMSQNPSYYKFFKASLPLIMDQDKMKKAIYEFDAEKGKSSLQKMSQAITSLNFSRENPNIKQAVTKMIQEFVSKMHTGEVNFKLLTNINFPAPNIFGEADTWGYPTDNIASSKFTLSYNDTYALIQQAYSLADQLKNQAKSF